ncbi:MAG: sialidase family protein, partial [Ktedonobacteraceae bacterium]
MRSFSRFRSRMSIVLSLVALASMIGGFVFLTGTGIATNKALAKSVTYSNLTPRQKLLLSGLRRSELASQKGQARTKTTAFSNYFPTSDDGCAHNQGDNIQVSQHCLNLSEVPSTSLQGRGQAQVEGSIASDPLHPNHLVSSYTDYSSGDGNCNSSFSRNAGQTWTPSTLPIGFTNGATFGTVERQYWQTGGEAAVAWDTKGNAYLECEVFMRGLGTSNNPDQSDAMYVFRSTSNGGASWDFPGRPVVENSNPNIIDDKSYLAIDDQVGSPFQDRVYVTWTLLASDGSAYIVASHSSDYGQSFSAPVVVSTSSTLCANTFGAGIAHGTCNANEFSQPFTGPDGALYVIYDNFNPAESNTNDNHYQVLLSKSTDGGVTFSSPVLVANYNDFPDCAIYQNGQNPGETCLPEKGTTTHSAFLTTNYPVGAIDPVNGSVVVTFGSYINAFSNPANGCAPQGFSVNVRNLYTGVKTAG